MADADPVTRAARNGFLVVIVALLGVGVYNFLYVEGGGMVVPGLWALGVVVFYGSRYYYRRTESDTVAGSEDPPDS